jgi:vacuolar-type H+-ATPase subunit H
MAWKVDPIQLSPLDQIRQTEAEVTRRLAAAREAAEQIVAKARLDAASLMNQTREEGQREGQARSREILSRGEEEARALITQAHSQAESLRRKGEGRMESVVRSVFYLIIGQEGDA